MKKIARTGKSSKFQTKYQVENVEKHKRRKAGNTTVAEFLQIKMRLFENFGQLTQTRSAADTWTN